MCFVRIIKLYLKFAANRKKNFFFIEGARGSEMVKILNPVFKLSMNLMYM